MGTASPSHPLPFVAFPCSNAEMMCVQETHPDVGHGPGGSEVEGQHAPRIKGWVQLPEVRAMSSILGSGSCSNINLVSQFICEVLQRVLKDLQMAAGARATAEA